MFIIKVSNSLSFILFLLSNSFSIQLNRVYFNIFKNNKRIIQEKIPHKIEFLSITFSNLRKDKIIYQSMVFPLKDEWQAFLPCTSDLSFKKPT